MEEITIQNPKPRNIVVKMLWILMMLFFILIPVGVVVFNVYYYTKHKPSKLINALVMNEKTGKEEVVSYREYNGCNRCDQSTVPPKLREALGEEWRGYSCTLTECIAPKFIIADNYLNWKYRNDPTVYKWNY